MTNPISRLLERLGLIQSSAMRPGHASIAESERRRHSLKRVPRTKLNGPTPARIKPLPPALRDRLTLMTPLDRALTCFVCSATTNGGADFPHTAIMPAEGWARLHEPYWTADYSTLQDRQYDLWPWEDETQTWLPIEQIAMIEDSPDLLPRTLSQEPLKVWEPAMGWRPFVMHMQNGERSLFDNPSFWDLYACPGTQSASLAVRIEEVALPERYAELKASGCPVGSLPDPAISLYRQS